MICRTIQDLMSTHFQGTSVFSPDRQVNSFNTPEVFYGVLVS